MSDKTPPRDPAEAFLAACCWHGSVEKAERTLAAHPEVVNRDIHVAATLGDDVAVRRFLALDPGNATAEGGPRDVDALTYLCFSAYLAADKARSEGFVRAATALLDAGASANTGFWDMGHKPEREWEPVLYGAAGVAHHAGVTRLLLERGANPNDEEVVYHTPETCGNEALKLIVETGKLTTEELGVRLIRKHDWHDYEGAKFLLERAGASVSDVSYPSGYAEVDALLKSHGP